MPAPSDTTPELRSRSFRRDKCTQTSKINGTGLVGVDNDLARILHQYAIEAVITVSELEAAARQCQEVTFNTTTAGIP
jgi:hypothetical protein